nr:hypothetical protein [Bacillaceae bacterium]
MNRDLVAGKIFAGSQGRRGWSPDAEGPVIRDPGTARRPCSPKGVRPLFAGGRDLRKTGDKRSGEPAEVQKPKTPFFPALAGKKINH